MRRALFLLLAAGLAGCAPAVEEKPALSRAEALADEVAEAMGGRKAMAATNYLRFDFGVEVSGNARPPRKHLWDCHTGRYRIEWINREKQRVQVLFNIHTRQGRAWVDGKPVEPEEELQPLLERAYGSYINDTYWLLMPWKLRDPGVNLEYVGQREVDGKTYEVLHLSFENVGLTPGDQYWAFINPESKIMERWAYFLQGMEGEPSLEGAQPFTWERWEQVGGVRLARDKVSAAGERNAKIYFPVLTAPASVDDAVFSSPTVELPGE